jgi:hypothetical protein
MYDEDEELEVRGVGLGVALSKGLAVALWFLSSRAVGEGAGVKRCFNSRCGRSLMVCKRVCVFEFRVYNRVWD